MHHQSSIPFTLTSGINVQTGFETYIGISRQYTNLLASPFSDCLKDLSLDSNHYAKKLFGYFKDLNVSYYDQNFCFTLCYQDKLIEKCDCCDIITPVIRNVTYCSNDDEINCYRKFNSFFKTADLNMLCDSACPQQCNTRKYILSTSMATYPTLGYLKTLQSIYNTQGLVTENDTTYFFPQNVSDTELMEFARTGLIKLIINYDDLYYTSIDEFPKVTFESFIGTLGGQFGIFMGFSLLSFIEIIDLTVSFIHILLNHKNLK